MYKSLFLVLALAVGIAAPCGAHATLVDSTPANNAQLGEAPMNLVLVFSEAARLGAVHLSGAGKNVALPINPSAAASASFELALPRLTAGKYTVRWTAVAADDGHVTHGSIGFSIAPRM